MKNDLSAEQLQQLVTVTLPLGVVLRITNGVAPAVTNILVEAAPFTLPWAVRRISTIRPFNNS